MLRRPFIDSRGASPANVIGESFGHAIHKRFGHQHAFYVEYEITSTNRLCFVVTFVSELSDGELPPNVCQVLNDLLSEFPKHDFESVTADSIVASKRPVRDQTQFLFTNHFQLRNNENLQI